MSDTKIKQNDGDEIIIDDLELSSDFSENKIEDSDKGVSPEVEKSDDDSVAISKSKLVLIKTILSNLQTSNEQLLKLLSSTVSSEDEERISIAQNSDAVFNLNSENTNHDDGRIIEGIFDGENMIGPDGKQYSVPANYASKSKLIEGDSLKLTITSKGTFVYKQIKPIDRRRVMGILSQETSGNYIVSAEDSKWHVLTASVTYYKGQIGDEIVLIVPTNGKSKWGAVDNIVKNVN